MDRVADGWVRLGAPVLVLLTALVGTLTALGANGFALHHACVPQSGPLAFLGSDFTLVRQTVGCPASMVDIGPSSGVAVTFVVVLTLPVLLAQLGVLTLLAAVSTIARRVAWRLIVLVLAVINTVLAVAHRPVGLLSVRRRSASPWSASPVRPGRRVVGARVIRGPPVGAFAVV